MLGSDYDAERIDLNRNWNGDNVTKGQLSRRYSIDDAAGTSEKESVSARSTITSLSVSW